MRETSDPGHSDAWWRLALDLWSAQVLVWLASVGRDAELTHSAHLFFSDRYRRLATWHAARGSDRRARRLRAKANDHHRAGGDDEPPYAAAMAMPRPRRFVVTNAVGTRRLDRAGSSDDAA